MRANLCIDRSAQQRRCWVPVALRAPAPVMRVVRRTKSWLKLITCNIARRVEAWRYLLETDAGIALLSEAAEPPADVARRLDVDPAPWRTAGAGVTRSWRAAVVKLSGRVSVQWLESKPVADALPGDLAVSRLGTLVAALVRSGTWRRS